MLLLSILIFFCLVLTEFKDCGDFYSVEGGVGSRIAQQLQKGDRVRIGINGRPQTHHVKLKQRTLSEEM